MLAGSWVKCGRLSRSKKTIHFILCVANAENPPLRHKTCSSKLSTIPPVLTQFVWIVSFKECGRLTFAVHGSMQHRVPGQHVFYLHGEQSCEVDLGDGLGPLASPLPHTASPVLGQLRLLAGFHQMPKPHSSLLPIIQHWGLWWEGTTVILVYFCWLGVVHFSAVVCFTTAVIANSQLQHNAPIHCQTATSAVYLDSVQPVRKHMTA